MISRCSPFSNGSSLGSSAEPGSIFQFNRAERKLGKTIKEKKTYSQTAPQLAMGLPLAVDFPLEPWLERWPLARSDSGLGHQCERLRFGLLSMEYCMLCPRKDRSWRVLVSLHSWNASFDRGRTMRRWNGISTDTSKGRLLWIKGYFHNRRRRADTRLASPLAPLPLDSKALGSKSVIFATSARGSCSVDLGPVPLRIVTFSVSTMGDWLCGVR